MTEHRDAWMQELADPEFMKTHAQSLLMEVGQTLILTPSVTTLINCC